MNRGAQVARAILGLGLGVLCVHLMREATLSTHDPIDPSSRAELVLEARAHKPEPTQQLEEHVEALILRCRLEVHSDLAAPIEHDGHGRFRAILTPSLDQTNRRQFRGCLQDWVIDHLRVDVVSIDELAADPAR